MGQTQGLLQKPQKDKNTDVGNIPAKLTYSASGIQGWRAFQVYISQHYSYIS